MSSSKQSKNKRTSNNKPNTKIVDSQKAGSKTNVPKKDVTKKNSNHKVEDKKKVNIEEIIVSDLGDTGDEGLEFVDLDNVAVDTKPQEDIKPDALSEPMVTEAKTTFGADVLELFKYFVMFSVIIMFGEIIMSIQLGGLSAQNMFALFFIPAQAMFFASLCGIGSNKASRITFPIIILLPLAFYIVHTMYLMTFGSLLSVSFLGMGNEAVGNFTWAMSDVLTKSIVYILIILAPIVLAVIISVSDIFSLKKYRLSVHLLGFVLVVGLWFSGILGIRAFGTGRTSPYMLFKSASATSDTVAKKLGVFTTTIVECGSYFFGIGLDDEEEFVAENVMITPVEVPDVTVNDGDISEGNIEEEVVSTPWINEGLDFAKLANEADNSEFRGLAGYLASRQPSTTNEHTGMFEGYNLIYICAESFWSYACNEKVTPTLYKMANNGIVLNNYYNSFNNTTTNGEFAFDTSLWPDVSRFSKNGTDIGSFAQSSTKYMPQGLGDLCKEKGIPAYAFHNYYGKYYRRILSWPNLGYKCRFTGDNMWFTSNWPASDLELMEQTVDDYINEEQFHAYYMTFSGHGPYTAKNYMYNKNIARVNELTAGDNYNDLARGYLAGEMELDMAMEYLLKRLEEAGKLDNTLIVLTSDHYPYYLDAESRDSLVGYHMDETFDIYKSTCIMYNAGMEQPLEVNDYCCNIDILPTVLNLFNIPFDSRMMMGRDVFSKEAHKRATLYNKSFISDMVRYNYETGEATWTAKGNQLSESDKEAYLDSQLGSIENEYTASCKMIDSNFFLTAYEKSGLLTVAEVNEEVAREQRAQSQDDTFNVEDEEEAARKEAERAAKEAAEAAAAEAAAQQQLLQDQLNALMLQNGGTLPDGTVAMPANPGVVPEVQQAAPVEQAPVVEQPAPVAPQVDVVQ